MIQQKHNVGALTPGETCLGNDDDDEDEALKQFMDRFDLSKE